MEFPFDRSAPSILSVRVADENIRLMEFRYSHF